MDDRMQELPLIQGVLPTLSAVVQADAATTGGLLDPNNRFQAIGDDTHPNVHSHPHAVIALDGGRIVFANRRVTDVFGWAPAKLIGEDVSILCCMDAECDDIVHRFNHVLHDKGVFYEELPCRRRDGTEIKCMVRIARDGEEGQNRLILMLYPDLADSAAGNADFPGTCYRDEEIAKRVEAATRALHRQIAEQQIRIRELQQSEEQYRSLTEMAQDHIVYLGLSGDIIYGNRSFCEALGYDAADLPKLAAEDVTTPKYVGLLKDRVARRAGGDESLFLTDFELVTKDGAVIPVECNLSLITEGGRPSGILVVARNISERKRMQEALGDTEKRYRQLFEGIEDAVIVVSFKGRIVDCNAVAFRCYGYSRAEFLALHIDDLICEEYQELRKQHIKNLLKGESILSESAHRCKDGRSLPVEVHMRMVDYRDDKAVLVTVREISRRKEMEKSLQEHKERLELAVYGGDLGMYDFDVVTATLQTNDRYWEILGYRRGEIEATFESFAALIHPRDLGHIIQDLSDVYKNPEQNFFSAELRIRHKSGEWKWILSKGKVVARDGKGNAIRISGANQDITEKKSAEESLAESETRFRRIVELTTEIIWQIDEYNRFVFVSPRVKDMVGYEPEELIGKTLFDLVPEREAERTKAMFEELKKEKKSFAFAENKIRCKDGKTVILENSGYPILDEDGCMQGYLGSFRNVTERHQAEKTLRKKDKELEALNRRLDDVNAALRVFLQHQENEKHASEDKIIANLKKLVHPYLDKLKVMNLNDHQASCVGMIENHLVNITSSFVHRMEHINVGLTPREIEIANHIKEGLSTKEIAKITNISVYTVNLHRNHIRGKLNLSNKKVNLRSYLASLT